MSRQKGQEADMLDVVQSFIEMAKKGGASDACVRAYRVRDVELDYRDSKVEKIAESTTRGVTIELFVAGHYSTVSTSDLRPDALRTLIGDTITIAKAISPDPFRALADPGLFTGQAAVDLQLEDASYDRVTMDEGRRAAQAAHDAARGVRGNGSILSVTSSFSSNLSETWMMTSNGFSGTNRATTYYVSTEVSAKDADGRRPEEYDFAGARHWSALQSPQVIGAGAAQRTLARLGSRKGESAEMMAVVENRAAGRLLGLLAAALQGSALQQKRSFLEGKLGQPLFSPLLTLSDDPLLTQGFGSRKFDNEGIAAKPRLVFDRGALASYYMDTYYGRKLQMAPTSGMMSNLSWAPGDKSQQQLVSDAKDGILITSFIGGNSNSGTGDFSVGVSGFRIRDGAVAEPVAEMNLSGNHLEFWKKLVAVGNDPFRHSSMRTPSLLFEGVSIAGV
jgi:PmbA protein